MPFTALAPTDPTGWLTPSEFAAAAKVSIKTVRRWIATNRIHAQRLGPRLIRVDPRSLAEVARPLNVKTANGRPEGEAAL